MSNALKRTILRAVHIVITIPILGYVYGKPAEVKEYASAVRFVFVPIILFSGYWMYAGAIFALAGVALWLGAYQLSGYGAAVLSQVVLFIGRMVWRALRARRASEPGAAA